MRESALVAKAYAVKFPANRGSKGTIVGHAIKNVVIKFHNLYDPRKKTLSRLYHLKTLSSQSIAILVESSKY